MANLIQATTIPGCSVYGVEQVSYIVDGAADKDYAAALTAAALKEAAAIETAATGYMQVVKQRQRKIEDLGAILSYLNEAYARLKTKDTTSGDEVSIDNATWVNETAGSYGITLVFVEGTNRMTRGNILKAQNDIQYSMDKEDNELQQDMVTLQGLVSKRDSSFSNAARIVQKSFNASDSAIRNMGQ